MIRQILVVPNIRYPDEVECVRLKGGFLVRVKRTGQETDLDDPLDAALADFEDWDDTVMNDGTIEELGTKAAALARRFWTEYCTTGQRKE